MEQKKTKPKISVIVPVYNTEKYLVKCLDSLVGQTLAEIEIVIVNDGSTDGSGEILEDYAKRYPDKIRAFHKENGGQASARNLALDVCQGEYIGFLDSDDFVKTDMFQKMYQCAVENHADYVACAYTDITYKNNKEVILKNYVASAQVTAPRQMFFDALVSPFIHLYKKEILDKSKVCFPEGVIYEDTAFYLNLIPYIHSVATIPESLAYRVRRNQSTTTTQNAKRIGQIFPVIDEIEKWYSANEICQKYQNEKEYFCVRVLLGSSMRRISMVESKTERNQLIEQTFQVLDRYYPNRRENQYLQKGLKNILIKHLGKRNIRLYVSILRIANQMKRKYE